VWRRRRVSADPERVARALDVAEDELDEGDVAAALRLLEDARHAARRIGDPHLLGQVEVLRAEALSEADRFAAALDAATAACAASPDDADAHYQRGRALYRLGRMEEAARAFVTATRLAPDDAVSWHALGRSSVWIGDDRAARDAFRRAARLDPESYVVPVRIASGEFDRLAAQAWTSIPAAFRSRLGRLIVAVEVLPPLDDVEAGFDPDTLGVYEGATALVDSDLPERIVLFQRNIENVSGDLGTLREEIRRTLLHEVGHHFGMEEDELPY
jgi:predicted Zn-dependent protease with MMP-like domain